MGVGQEDESNMYSADHRDKQHTPVITPSLCPGGMSKESYRSRQSVKEKPMT